MFVLVNKLFSGYNEVVQWGDPRSNRYLLTRSPMFTLIIISTYFLFIFKIGPDFMKNRKPYNLQKIIMFYNLVQIIFNMLAVVLTASWYRDINVLCIPIDNDDFVTLHWIYLLLKIFDLIDTIFFVLRKNYKQITFLHVYHHSLMVIGSWLTLKYVPGGQMFVLGYINCFVHAVMYLYYFLTSLDSNYKKLWWKRHLTQLQITQHCLVFLSHLMPLLNPSCTYPKAMSALVLIMSLFMIYLFTNFYVKAYYNKKDSKKTA